MEYTQFIIGIAIGIAIGALLRAAMASFILRPLKELYGNHHVGQQEKGGYNPPPVTRLKKPKPTPAPPKVREGT